MPAHFSPRQCEPFCCVKCGGSINSGYCDVGWESDDDVTAVSVRRIIEGTPVEVATARSGSLHNPDSGTYELWIRCGESSSFYLAGETEFEQQPEENCGVCCICNEHGTIESVPPALITVSGPSGIFSPMNGTALADCYYSVYHCAYSGNFDFPAADFSTLGEWWTDHFNNPGPISGVIGGPYSIHSPIYDPPDTSYEWQYSWQLSTAYAGINSMGAGEIYGGARCVLMRRVSYSVHFRAFVHLARSFHIRWAPQGRCVRNGSMKASVLMTPDFDYVYNYVVEPEQAWLQPVFDALPRALVTAQISWEIPH
jgi:hypothetical protein